MTLTDQTERRTPLDAAKTTWKRSPSETTAVVALAIAIATAAAAGIVASRRRTDQKRRIAGQPDDAPELTRRTGRTDDVALARSVTINRPRADVYAFWRDLRNLPKIIDNITEVTSGANGGAIWSFAAPGGAGFELATEITEERENEMIAWRSVAGSDIEAEGAVRFRDAQGRRGTIVQSEVHFRPPGGELGRMVGRLFQRAPAVQTKRDLKRLKMLMETGEVATSSNRVHA